MSPTATVIGDDPRPLLAHKDQLIALDSETTGLKWEHDLLGFSLAWHTGTGSLNSCYVAVPNGQSSMVLFETPEHLNDPAHFLSEIAYKHRIAGHNLPFDYRVLFKSLGLPPIRRSIDTMHLAKCLQFEQSLSLVNLAKENIGPGKLDPQYLAMKGKRKTLKKLPVEDQAGYARQDAEITLELAETLDEKAKQELPEKLLDRDERFSHLVMALVNRGVPVDIAHVETRKRDHRRRIMEIETLMARKGLRNVSSDKQVSGFFASMEIETGVMTKTGRMSVSAEALESYKDIEEVALVIEHRQLHKAIGSWFNPLLLMAGMDGKAHSQLYPFGARSFRMSSEDINLQGLPMEERGKRAFGSMMGVFTSDIPEMALYSIDLKQAEVRMAAMLSGEHNLAEVLASGDDPYVGMALDMWNDGSRRQGAKQAVLSSLYEVGPGTFSLTYDVSMREAQSTLGRFRRRYPRIKKASRKWEKYVEKHGYVPLPDQHRRYFGPFDEAWKAFNQLVQGTVAAVMAGVMLETEAELPEQLLLQVHDSAVMYLPLDDTERNRQVGIVQDIVDSILPERMKENVSPLIPLPLDTKLWQMDHSQT